MMSYNTCNMKWYMKPILSWPTSFLSLRFVTMTMVAVFCSQIILQKSFNVSSFGPERRTEKKKSCTQIQ